jgi:hypothetical protein
MSLLAAANAALMSAIAAKDANPVGKIISNTSRGQRGPMAAALLQATNSLARRSGLRPPYRHGPVDCQALTF